MGKMGLGYGSEFHLLRYLGYHRSKLNSEIKTQAGLQVMEWFDFPHGTKEKLDAEWKGVDFVNSTSTLKSAWQQFWPQTGNVPNWDAVGRLESNSGTEYVLVEAKAHVDELQSSCAAKENEKQGGLNKIKDAMEMTIKNNGFASNPDQWVKPYYQYANRLAHIDFLARHGVHAHLVFIYFCGDDWSRKTLSNGRAPNCPKDSNEWTSPLKKISDHLGLRGQSQIEKQVHKVFLDILPK
jgi:hypothetical protein